MCHSSWGAMFHNKSHRFVSFYHEMPHNLTNNHKRTLRIIAVITVHQGDTFKQWADNVFTKDGTLLFGKDRGKNSLLDYCQQSRLRNLKESYRTFLSGRKSTRKTLSKDDSNPLPWLQDKHPIRALTNEEFAFQSHHGSLPSILTMPRPASKTLPRGRSKVKDEL
jgi:hypothetical protein